jgi:DNA-binding transcriptional ArsR family regulator
VADRTDDLFRALADPTRRRILDLLATRDSMTVGGISDRFPALVASGISKHLMYLRACGLVSAERRGRLRLYRIDEKAMAAALSPWVAKYERFWSNALERLRKLSEGNSEAR